MQTEHGFALPRRLQVEFSKAIQHITEDSGTEIAPDVMWSAFEREYLLTESKFKLESHEMRSDSKGSTSISAQMLVDGNHAHLRVTATDQSMRSYMRCEMSSRLCLT